MLKSAFLDPPTTHNWNLTCSSFGDTVNLWEGSWRALVQLYMTVEEPEAPAERRDGIWPFEFPQGAAKTPVLAMTFCSSFKTGLRSRAREMTRCSKSNSEYKRATIQNVQTSSCSTRLELLVLELACGDAGRSENAFLSSAWPPLSSVHKIPSP